MRGVEVVVFVWKFWGCGEMLWEVEGNEVEGSWMLGFEV